MALILDLLSQHGLGQSPFPVDSSQTHDKSLTRVFLFKDSPSVLADKSPRHQTECKEPDTSPFPPTRTLHLVSYSCC